MTHDAVMLLVVTDDDRLLLHHRDDKPTILHPDCWAGFGGAVEEGEALEDALRREVQEETGLHVADVVYLGEEIDVEGDCHRVHLFVTRGGIDIGDIELNEGAGVGLFTFAEATHVKLTPFVRRAIENHLCPHIAD